MTRKRDNLHVAAKSTVKTMTFRPHPDVYRAIRFLCADLDISGHEFIRRAVAREIAYNNQRVQRKEK